VLIVNDVTIHEDFTMNLIKAIGVITILITAEACFSEQDKRLRCELNWVNNTISLSDSSYFIESLELFNVNPYVANNKRYCDVSPENKVHSWQVDFCGMSLKNALRRGGEGSTISLKGREKNESGELVPLLFIYQYSHKDTLANVYLRWTWH